MMMNTQESNMTTTTTTMLTTGMSVRDMARSYASLAQQQAVVTPSNPTDLPAVDTLAAVAVRDLRLRFERQQGPVDARVAVVPARRTRLGETRFGVFGGSVFARVRVPAATETEVEDADAAEQRLVREESELREPEEPSVDGGDEAHDAEDHGEEANKEDEGEDDAGDEDSGRRVDPAEPVEAAEKEKTSCDLYETPIDSKTAVEEEEEDGDDSDSTASETDDESTLDLEGEVEVVQDVKNDSDDDNESESESAATTKMAVRTSRTTMASTALALALALTRWTVIGTGTRSECRWTWAWPTAPVSVSVQRAILRRMWISKYAPVVIQNDLAAAWKLGWSLAKQHLMAHVQLLYEQVGELQKIKIKVKDSDEKRLLLAGNVETPASLLSLLPFQLQPQEPLLRPRLGLPLVQARYPVQVQVPVQVPVPVQVDVPGVDENIGDVLEREDAAEAVDVVAEAEADAEGANGAAAGDEDGLFGAAVEDIAVEHPVELAEAEVEAEAEAEAGAEAEAEVEVEAAVDVEDGVNGDDAHDQDHDEDRALANDPAEAEVEADRQDHDEAGAEAAPGQAHGDAGAGGRRRRAQQQQARAEVNFVRRNRRGRRRIDYDQSSRYQKYEETTAEGSASYHERLQDSQQRLADLDDAASRQPAMWRR